MPSSRSAAARRPGSIAHKLMLGTAAIARGEADECVWLLEHSPLYTAGTSANQTDKGAAIKGSSQGLKGKLGP